MMQRPNPIVPSVTDDPKYPAGIAITGIEVPWSDVFGLALQFWIASVVIGGIIGLIGVVGWLVLSGI